MTTSARVRARRLLVLGATAAAGAAFLSPVGPATADSVRPPAATTAQLTVSDTAVRVKVTSTSPACEKNRQVVILSSYGEGLGGTTGRSDAKGVVRVPRSQLGLNKRVFAYVLRTPGCRAASSNVAQVPEQMGGRVAATAAAATSATMTYNDGRYRVKVTSPKPTCAKNRKVDLIGFQPGNGFAEGFAGTTNSDGVFRYPPAGGPESSGGDTFKVVAFVRKSAGCGLGQTNVITFTEL